MRNKRTITYPIYCCQCEKDIDAHLVSGRDIYPHLPKLSFLKIWQCPTCKNYIGCHNQKLDKTKPLGCIPSPKIKNGRKHINNLIGSIYMSGLCTKSDLYDLISKRTGRKYNTANTRTIKECRHIYRIILNIKEELKKKKEAKLKSLNSS